MQKIGKRRSIGSFLFALLLAIMPTGSNGEISFNDLHRLLIVGRWEQVSDVYAISEFTASMLYEANVYRSEQRKERLAHLRGVWQVENGNLIIKLTHVSPPRLPIGSVVSEKIHLINGRKLILIDKNGQRYTKLRLRTEER